MTILLMGYGGEGGFADVKIRASWTIRENDDACGIGPVFGIVHLCFALETVCP
jgi:hypothetical protein